MKGAPRKKRILKADEKDDKRRQVLVQELLHKVEVGAKDESGVGPCSMNA